MILEQDVVKEFPMAWRKNSAGNFSFADREGIGFACGCRGCIDFDLWRGHTGGTASGVVQPNPHPLLAACVNLEFCASICSQMGHGWAGAEVPAGGARQSAPGDAPRARTHVASAHSKLVHKVPSFPTARIAVGLMGALVLKAALGHTHLAC